MSNMIRLAFFTDTQLSQFLYRRISKQVPAIGDFVVLAEGIYRIYERTWISDGNELFEAQFYVKRVTSWSSPPNMIATIGEEQS